jgi:hypothetical protein
MKLKTRKIKFGNKLFQQLEKFPMPNSEIVRRISRKIKNGNIELSRDKELELDKPIMNIDVEITEDLRGIPPHLIREALTIEFQRVKPPLKPVIDKDDMQYSFITG